MNKKNCINKREWIRLALACMLGASILTACHEAADDGNTVGTEVVSVNVDTLINACHVTSEYQIAYPTAGAQPLLDSIRTWMSNQFGGSYTGDFSDAQSIVNYYANAICRQAAEDFDGEEGLEYEINYSSVANLTKDYETDKTVTFTLSNYNYTGGAHGMGVFEARTFRKDTGAALTWDIIDPFSTDEVQRMIIDQLKTYFDVTTDDELNVMLLDTDVYNLLFPATPPAFREDGVYFIYQSYEIAPYSAGKPDGFIPYDKILPHLVPEAVAVLPEGVVEEGEVSE
ncbi:MAG: DUF3298 and DUF4163 domain-containing protein [Clostridium sp.]|nr:DUF3298 and DUF4163 domain-containing protein [Clostridium sp.]